MNFVLQSALFKAGLKAGPSLVLAIATVGCGLVYTEPVDPLSRAAHAGDLTQVQALLADGGHSPSDALQWAARGGHPAGPHRCGYERPDRLAIVRALIAAGADVNAPDGREPRMGGSSGWTPLHVALHHAQFAIAAELVDRGADPGHKSDQGMTPLEMAKFAHAPDALMQKMTARQSGARR